jgi:hypothetical protein
MLSVVVFGSSLAVVDSMRSVPALYVSVVVNEPVVTLCSR